MNKEKPVNFKQVPYFKADLCPGENCGLPAAESHLDDSGLVHEMVHVCPQGHHWVEQLIEKAR
jgi:hypothetical protein